MEKKIAILQPNYIPWKGVFDQISQVDVFVFYDDVQYTIKDWRNRNRIMTKNGELWLSVPVIHKGKRDQLIVDTLIDTSVNWQENHYKTIKNNYVKAKYFREYEYILEKIYLDHMWTHIADLDIFATKIIAKALDLDVQWERSSELSKVGSKNGEKAIAICKELNCNYFINGPSSKEFLNEDLFAQENIKLKYMEYDYRQYRQLYKSFNHYVTVLDVLFNCGKDASSYICSK